MEPQVTIPTIEEIKSFLEGYGWNYRETTGEDKPVILAPFLTFDKKGILISFRVEGEFVMVSTLGLLNNVPVGFAKNLLEISDRIKLVKLFIVNQNSPETLDAEVGFELWNEAWNKETFYAFMDMLGMGIETVLEKITAENIPHETKFVTFG